ncbi:hypothetical protein IGI04_022560 [Brassica rapa subsp. trilocularis]|uniref:Uncharacterized protein n=1 Tax=Brassica rapa subsp. trilocularis TaxID=1813537 RepID=A0ABQ7M1A0_BRACM|nr:hypothetical protein IGI04_022560 [Brassica rapa subsp. trilocularis]
MIWNTKLKKKLSQMGIGHVTHRPFSLVLAEYGNINGGGTLNPNPLNHTASLRHNHSLNEDSHQQQPGDSGDLMFHLQAIKAYDRVIKPSQARIELYVCLFVFL